MANDKAIIGAIGENMVVTKLLENGWATLNVNTMIKNFKSIDLICLRMKDDSWEHDSVLVQVKTLKVEGKNKDVNFPTGFDIEQSKDEEYLKKAIKGPYVFVLMKEAPSGYEYEYYILSRKQMIDLLLASNTWYLSWPRKKGIKEKSVPAGLLLHWLRREGDKAHNGRKEFFNPLADQPSTKDNWNNIRND